jgi:hypothetical protein
MYLSFRMVDHDIVGLDITMHDTFTVTEIQSLEQLIDIESHIIIDEAGIKNTEVCIVDILKDQARSLALAVAHHVEQGDNVGTARQIL